MDLESPLPRGYPPPSSTMLFDDDPGIMSEVETSSTGFRRGGKQRSSLPVVRTPSKTLERPLGLVFLQYRNETKRALLPNEITSIDTVKALFVRSFPKQLTMEYLDSPHVKVYIHDSNKDMFYELEDLRSHLRDIRDRSVLRLFESSDGVTGMPGPLGIPGTGTGLPPHWEDQSYFSEPEFDSEYQHQHIHKSKTAKNSTSGSSGYYVGGSSTLPRGGQLMRAYSPAASSVVGGPNATPTQPKPLATPDGWIGGGGVPPAKPLRSYQCGKSPLGSLGGSARFSRDSSVSLYSIADRLHGESGYMSSPERGGGVGSGTGRYPPGPYSAGSSYEDPYYSQYSGTVTPVIDEEASGWCSDTELLEESYSLYGVKPPGRPPSGPPRSPFPPGAPPPLPPGGQSYDATRIRVEHMERQLANLTGLVQKALTHAPHTSPSPRDYLQVPAGRDPYARGPGAGDEFDKHSSSSSASLPVSQPAVTDDSYLRTDVKPPKLGKDKSVSFEKSVSFSDEPPDMNSPKQHSPQHAADTKPTKPAIKSSTLPRMSSQERDRHKPTPPPKPAALVGGQYVYRDMALTPEMYNQLRGLQRKAKDLKQEVRNLRRMSQTQAHTIRETILDTFFTIRTMLLSCGDAAWDAEKIRLSREEDLYRQEMLRLVKDLTELENTVEELRGNVINRKTRVNMSDVENMALIMSKSSKTVADLKVRFPSLQEGMKGLLSSEMEMVVRAEKFLKEEPERLESALKRCKKLTSTLVTLKRLASVQEQRLPNAAASVDAEETPPITPTSAQHSKAAAPVPAERTVVGSASVIGGGSHPHEPPAAHQQRPENALDALLDELQTFSRPSSQQGHTTQGSTTMLSELGRSSSGSRGEAAGASTALSTTARPPCISDIGRKGSVDSSSGATLLPNVAGTLVTPATAAGGPGPPNAGGMLRRLHSYPSSSDTDTSPPIARLQVSLQEQPSLPTLPQGFVPGQKPPVPERNAELLQLASARRVPPPPPPRTSSRSPLASPTSPQLPPRNHSYNLQSGNATLRRPPPARGTLPVKEGKPPMALPTEQQPAPVSSSALDGVVVVAAAAAAAPSPPVLHNNSTSSQSSAVLSTSNSSSCESVNSQEGLQSKKGRQEQLEQRHQELLRKQKALQEQYARLQQLQRNTAGLTTIPPAPPDLLKKTGSESNLLAKMGLGLSTASSGSLTSLTVKPASVVQEMSVDGPLRARHEGESNEQQQQQTTNASVNVVSTSSVVGTGTSNTTISSSESNGSQAAIASATISTAVTMTAAAAAAAAAAAVSNAASTTTTTTTSKIYETDIL
ncbi:coiled-coil domain-containing protein AGAP005037 isoform X4 [Frieseomelitta varia]|uniref:coiled-coil domain-containing protein AGAP005037 isoform X4 n=1 Tax=Frieseomelitta varia TaxID=561572 RepID=UPI001CB67B8E|nr:coiled-coil domain-containing protein AGAP005037 isoform X4 [Frieseomelitta varia]